MSRYFIKRPPCEQSHASTSPPSPARTKQGTSNGTKQETVLQQEAYSDWCDARITAIATHASIDGVGMNKCLFVKAILQHLRSCAILALPFNSSLSSPACLLQWDSLLGDVLVVWWCDGDDDLCCQSIQSATSAVACRLYFVAQYLPTATSDDWRW